MTDPFDTCTGCSAPLAPDQRYCISCGQRRTETPAFGDGPPAGDAAGASARSSRWAGRPLPSPRTLALGAMGFILAGVLAGAAIGPPTSEGLAAAARQVVVVSGAGAGTGAPADSGPSTGDEASVPADTGAGGETAAPPDASAAPDESATAASAGGDTGSVPLDDSATTIPETSGTTDTAPAAKPSIGHVFVLVLDGGHTPDESFGSAAAPGYLRDELPKRGRLLAGYRAISTGALSNRIALVSGQPATPQTDAGCAAYDCVYGAEVKTVADQLSSVGLTWRAYVEGATAPCRRPDPTDPFVYFHSLVDTPECAHSVLGLDKLTTDLRTERTTPTLSWLVPAPPAPGAPPVTDAFLRRWVPTIMRAPAFRKDGLLVVTFDRPPAAGADAPTGAVVISPFVAAGKRDARAYDHYGLLRTLEDRLGLPALGRAARPGVRSLPSDTFDRELAPLAPPDALATTATRSRP